VRCTATFAFPAESLPQNGKAVALELEVLGAAVPSPDGYFAAIDILDAKGSRLAPRMFGYAHATGVSETVRAILSADLLSAGAEVQVLLSANDGSSMEFGFPRARRVEEWDRRLPMQVRTVFDVFRRKAYPGKKALEWGDVERRLAGLSQNADDDAATVITTVRNLASMLAMPHATAMSAGVYEASPCPDAMEVVTDDKTMRIISGPFMALGDPQCHDMYAKESARRVVDALRSHGVRAVVVDLRSNSGGNMWPMLYALRPFLGEGRLLGYAGAEQRWVELTDGRLREDGRQVFPDLGVAYERSKLPVEVWICAGTASSGEAAAIALKDSGATLVGEPTRGLTTANDVIELPHGVRLLLTTGVMTSSAGEPYGGAIRPDIVRTVGCD